MTDSESMTGSITLLLRKVETGDQKVLQDLFDYYFRGLAARAKKLIDIHGGARVSDEEDLVMMVMTAFLNDLTAGELQGIRDRHDVWRLLYRRIQLRSINLVRDERRSKKKEVGESHLEGASGSDAPLAMQMQPGRNIECLLEYQDELIEQLKQPVETQIAQLLFEGRDVSEISQLLGKSPATIYRKIDRIRSRWTSDSSSI
ncbi:MAG: ECF-type sigma factor [Pirellulaceae bacterium]|jgi:DNA-directed RNA polymerase specialized sigma24 family protein